MNFHDGVASLSIDCPRRRSGPLANQGVLLFAKNNRPRSQGDRALVLDDRYLSLESLGWSVDPACHPRLRFYVSETVRLTCVEVRLKKQGMQLSTSSRLRAAGVCTRHDRVRVRASLPSVLRIESGGWQLSCSQLVVKT